MKGKEVLGVLQRAQWMRCQVQRVEECLELLEPDEAAVVEILLESDDKIMAVCEELGVSERTAYRVISRVLEKLRVLFLENYVAIP